MSKLDAALNRFAVAADAVEARVGALLAAAKTGAAAQAEREALQAENGSLRSEVERLSAEIRALDDLHADVTAKLDAAIRDVQSALAA